MTNPPLLPWLPDTGLNSDRTQPLLTFAADVLRFNHSQNLVSRRDPIRQINRMIWEAVAVSRSLQPAAGPSLDLGSGAGFPGIPLAILQPGSPMDLLERRGARCDFLRRELSALDLGHVRVLEADAAELSRDPAFAGSYARVWLKAVAEPATALELARPFLTKDGSAALFRDENWRLDKDLLDLWDAYRRIPIAPEPSGRAEAANAVHVFHI